MGTYSIGIVGESFANDDGSSRQAELARCKVGEPVTLAREPGNPHDPNCVRVLSARGVQIGNISRDHPWICERLDGRRFVAATVEFVGRSESGKLGMVITVRTDGTAAASGPGVTPARTAAKLDAAGQSLTGAGCAILKGCFGLSVLVALAVIVLAAIRG
jgi:hypothetical protein